MAVATVGTITNEKQANKLLEEGLNLAVVGRMFQRHPYVVWDFAEELGVQYNLANEIGWGFGGRLSAPMREKGKM